MTLDQFLTRLARETKRSGVRWWVHPEAGALRCGERYEWQHCPLTFVVGAIVSVDRCARVLRLRRFTAERIARAADDSTSADGLRTRLLRAVGVQP